MYDAATGQRLPVTAGDGAALGDAIPLATLPVGTTAGQRDGVAQRTVAVVAGTVIGLAAGYIIVSAETWAFHYLIDVPTPVRS